MGIPHCKKVPQQHCSSYKVPHCKKVPHQECHKEYKKKCHTVDIQVPVKKEVITCVWPEYRHHHIPPTANLLNNKSANNFNIKNLMETTCEQKWALILQTGWSLSLTFLLGITAVPYSTSTHVSLFITT